MTGTLHESIGFDRELPQDLAAEQSVLGGMLLSATAVSDVTEIVSAEDFYRPAHQTIYGCLLDLYKQGEPADPITVSAELERRGELLRVGGAPYLHTLIATVPTAANASYYAEIVAEKAVLRRLVEAGTRIVQLGYNGADGADVDEVVDRAQGALSRAAARTGQTAGVRTPAIELDDFLGSDMPEYDWLVPGLLERMDRLILTGEEGGGKSTFLRQLSVQLASGIHPFGGKPFEPIRVLLLDLENSPRQVHRKLRPIRLVAGGQYSRGAMNVYVRPEGIDLLDDIDVRWIRALVEDTAPNVLITGPAYKMAGGDPTEERTAKAVAMHLDYLRATYQCAIVLEAHTPYATGGGKRPTRPYGASLWSRWPEFGVFLSPDGQLEHWRGPRDEREWPEALQRGGIWPWMAAPEDGSSLWGQIVNYCVRNGGTASQRQLAKALDSSLGSVNRAIGRHRAEWEAMGGR